MSHRFSFFDALTDWPRLFWFVDNLPFYFFLRWSMVRLVLPFCSFFVFHLCPGILTFGCRLLCCVWNSVVFWYFLIIGIFHISLVYLGIMITSQQTLVLYLILVPSSWRKRVQLGQESRSTLMMSYFASILLNRFLSKWNFDLGPSYVGWFTAPFGIRAFSPTAWYNSFLTISGALCVLPFLDWLQIHPV